MQLFEEVGAGVYFLKEYDSTKIPILFIHGISGSPQAWKPFFEKIDDKNFQAWFYHYPSGYKIEDITEALWGMRVSAGTVSDLNKKMYERIEKWRNRKIEGRHPYVYLDGISLKRTWGGEVRNVSVLVAIGVGEDGFRDILGVAEGCKEDKAGWSSFLAYLGFAE